MRYGQVDTLAYDLEFDGLLPSDNPSTFTTVDGRNHGTLAAVPLISTIGASETPYQAGIARVAPEGADAGPFFSCNYDITYDTETNAVTVAKAPLAIQALDTAGTYGGNEPEYKWDIASNQPDFTWEGQTCAGLAPWDTAESIFTEEPTVVLDTNATDGKPFSELDGGTYNNALVLNGGASQNYGIASIPGKLVVSPADFSDADRFMVDVKDATYNAEAQVAQVVVVDRTFDPARTLEQDTQFKVVYLGNHTDAGMAYVAVAGAGANYTGRQVLQFEIRKAAASIDTESAVKVYDGEALTAQGAISGILSADQYTFKTTGKQTNPGVSRNIYDLTFKNPAKANNYTFDESVGRLAVVSNDAKDFFVSDVVDYTYDGTEHKQAVTVRNHLLQELVEGEDYTLSYEGDLVNAGTVTIVINGAGAYTGSVTRAYQIKPAQLLVYTFDDAKVYDGTPLVGDGEVWRLVGDETVTFTVTGTQTEVGSSPNTYTLTWDGTAREGNYEIDERVGTLTVNAPDTAYYCESGAGGVWTKGSSETLGFVYKRTWDDETTFDHFKGLSVDGKPVSAKGYEARRGSVVVDLLPSYLEALDTGSHTLTTEFDDGDDVTVAFEVKEGAKPDDDTPADDTPGDDDVPGDDTPADDASSDDAPGEDKPSKDSPSRTSSSPTSSSPTSSSGTGRTSAPTRTSTVPRTGDPTPQSTLVALALGALGIALCVLSMRSRQR
ncbi:MAG: hypothetical protein IKG18_08580 [Atopobiaceae bacterium]|nr:hypothetical protein [Atopobiaceae bacterium]